VKLKFVITVRENVWVTPLPQDDGRAGKPGAGGLFPFAEIRGGEQYYGLRDVGLGPSTAGHRFFLKQGTYTATFAWDGRNWRGPSDTNQPKGPPFPPGTYEARVRVVGKVDRHGMKSPYEAEATAAVELTE
jgi:hypothetical protein